MKLTKTEQRLKEALEKKGIIYHPNLPGNPHFAHFDTKIAVYLGTKAEHASLNWMKRFEALRSKGWHVIWITKEDTVGKSLDRIMGFVTTRQYAKYRTPPGPEPIAQKLIELLKQTEMEERKRIDFWITWGLKTRRRNIESHLHHLFKPKILKKDNYKCRACSSTDNLELVRLYGGVSASFEERWSEKNMFTLCENCHKIFESFMRRMWRFKLKISNVEDAIQLLRSKNLSEFPVSPTESLRE